MFTASVMKQITITLWILFSINTIQAQRIVPGNYDAGLKIAYDSSIKKITGYFENYTGFDEQTKQPRFSCIFYIEGTVTGDTIDIATYYPTDKAKDSIKGTMVFPGDQKLYITLPKEHGGCWNVQHFADEPVIFSIEKKYDWIQIRYVNTPKTFFYSGIARNKKLKSYLIRGDFVCIEKIEGQWV